MLLELLCSRVQNTRWEVRDETVSAQQYSSWVPWELLLSLNTQWMLRTHWTHASECHDERVGSRLSQQFSVVRLASQKLLLSWNTRVWDSEGLISHSRLVCSRENGSFKVTFIVYSLYWCAVAYPSLDAACSQTQWRCKAARSALQAPQPVLSAV